jgi:3,5-epimerase/4-reductase
MNVIVLGNGFIASHLPYIKVPDRLDIDMDQILSVIDNYKPDCVINTIGFCGVPNIDQCEIEKDRTTITNITIPILLAEACFMRSAHLIHIGSGCIFYGKSPNERYGICGLPYDYGWKETDLTHPKSFYAKSKYYCDLVIGNMPNVTVLRIRMPFSSTPHPRNIINKLLQYNKIINIPNSMTFVDDLVNCVAWMSKNRHAGIFHVTNHEPLTAVDIIREYNKYNYHSFEIIDERELDKLTVAKRSNCILDTEKLYRLGFSMTPSRRALQLCMATFVKNI